MTLDMDICPDAYRRTEAARHLIDRTQGEELVDLVVLSAMDLCVLGAPRHPLFDEDVARAWSRLGGRQRNHRALVGKPHPPLRTRLNLAPNWLRGNPR